MDRKHHTGSQILTHPSRYIYFINPVTEMLKPEKQKKGKGDPDAEWVKWGMGCDYFMSALIQKISVKLDPSVHCTQGQKHVRSCCWWCCIHKRSVAFTSQPPESKGKTDPQTSVIVFAYLPLFLEVLK